MKTKILFIAIALVAMTAVVSAQDKQSEKPATTQTRGIGYVDANKDGVCDNYVKGNRQGKGLKDGSGRKQGKGKGVGNRQGKRDGSGAGKGNFVDTNKNGVCDNRE